MNYILTSLNQTSSRAIAVKNFIQMAFKIDPREVRYDTVPSIVTRLNEVNPSDREILIKERVDALVTSISRSLGINVNIIGTEKTNDRITVSLQIAEERIKIKL